jgi:hypothetical protein
MPGILMACLIVPEALSGAWHQKIISILRGLKGTKMFDFSDLKAKCGTDSKLELEGVWIESTVADGVEWLIARENNPRHEKKYNDLMAPHYKTIRKGKPVNRAKERKARIIAISETILLDWRGMKEEYSRAAAVALLTDFRDILEEVEDFSRDVSAFRAEYIEDSEKN